MFLAVKPEINSDPSIPVIRIVIAIVRLKWVVSQRYNPFVKNKPVDCSGSDPSDQPFISPALAAHVTHVPGPPDREPSSIDQLFAMVLSRGTPFMMYMCPNKAYGQVLLGKPVKHIILVRIEDLL